MLALPSIDSINTVIGAEATQFNITLQRTYINNWNMVQYDGVSNFSDSSAQISDYPNENFDTETHPPHNIYSVKI